MKDNSTMGDDNESHLTPHLRTLMKAENGSNIISPTIQGQNISNITINLTTNLGKSGGETQNSMTVSDKLLQDTKTIHKSMLRGKFECVHESIAKPGQQPLLNDLYTNVWITEGECGEINSEHEVRDIKAKMRKRTQVHSMKRKDIFKPLLDQKQVKTVLTKGIAGIGKTITVQKFILDWAAGLENQEFDLIFVFPFRELNLIKKEISLLEVVQQYYPHMKKDERILTADSVKSLFIFDGLDESKLLIDFYKCPPWLDEEKSTSLGVLLTNLIRGNLLPSASLWITSRPAATCQIPAVYISRVTEIQGFENPEKEEYFRKKCKNETLADKMVSYIRTQRSLYIMCYVPAFCWILATVLEQTLNTDHSGYIPRTLAEIYTNFLIVLLTFQNQKYEDQARWTSYSLLESNQKSILSLAQLAFENLERGDIIFYENELRKYHIDISKPSVYSGVCKDIFIENSTATQDKVYTFVHLTIQEYFAALHVFATYQNKKRNALKKKNISNTFPCAKSTPSLFDVYKSALDKSILSKNGHLDLFLRFLLGIGTDNNQKLLNGLFNPEDNSEDIKQICSYIKDLIRKDVSPERCINLFHCLNELNDSSLVEEIKMAINSRDLLKQRQTPSLYSGLAYILQMCEDETDELNLHRYHMSEEGVLRMLPVAKFYKRLVLEQCGITAEGGDSLAFTLSSHQSKIKELELGWNILEDSGVIQLCTGLIDPNCKLQKLGLKQCGLKSGCCKELASVLSTNHSHLRDLELRMNQIEDSGVKLLSAGLTHVNCKLQKLGLENCGLTSRCCEDLASLLCTNQSNLRVLELGKNVQLGDLGVKLLCAGLKDPKCKLKRLGLESCGLTSGCCEDLASVLCTNQSVLKELNLRMNQLGDSGVTLLSVGLSDPNCKLQALGLQFCSLTGRCCEALASALCTSQSNLRDLDLGANKLEDPGVKLISTGLRDPNCKLQKLKLGQCSISSVCCEDLFFAACANHSDLRELDLRDNEMCDLAVEYLSVALKDPHCKLQNICLLGSHLLSWTVKQELKSLLGELRCSGRDIIVQVNEDENKQNFQG
ncbi:NACHT, LRR and PYD domains-containing protein 3-like isoform X2 [Acipenser ruthenus]|nr:NACHT, LRR and PYD domains-containing protein 3-like isoform X2 [Acipenser ruthenus]